MLEMEINNKLVIKITLVTYIMKVFAVQLGQYVPIIPV